MRTREARDHGKRIGDREAQQTGPTGRGQVSVTVKGEDGSVLSGVGVFLSRALAPGAPPRQRTDWSATASAAGAVTFDLLPNGQYTLCAQPPAGNWLNPPNPETRAALKQMIERARAARREAYVYVNNRLEGNAPLTIEAVVE